MQASFEKQHSYLVNPSSIHCFTNSIRYHTIVYHQRLRERREIVETVMVFRIRPIVTLDEVTLIAVGVPGHDVADRQKFVLLLPPELRSGKFLTHCPSVEVVCINVSEVAFR